MPSHWQFGHLQPKLWAKEGPGVKLAVWLPTTKSRESMPSRHPIWVCDMALERSRRGPQLRFRPRRDPSRQSRVMAVQSSGSPIGTISGLHFGSPGNLCHLDVGAAERRRVYYREYGGGILPRSGLWCVSWSKVPVACPNTQGCPGMWTNHVGGLFWCRFKIDLLVPLPSLIPGLPTRPSTPF
jgi:hypothetical protein